MSDTADLLVEIGTEELPYAAQAPLALGLEDTIESGLADHGLTPAEITPFWGPRRLAILASALPRVEPTRAIERRGPNVRVAFDSEGRPTKAAHGFARSVGVKVDELETLHLPEGEWLVHRHTEKGRPTLELLSELLPKAFERLPLPRRMRWGTGEWSFLRPVRWLLVRFGHEMVPIEAFGLTAGGESCGHRVHHPGPVLVRSPKDYVSALRKAQVLVDPQERFTAVREMVDTHAQEIGGTPAPPSDELYTEIAGMVEWPVAVTASFDPRFLALGDPVVVTTLAHHQRFVPVRRPDGTLENRFVAVVNLESRNPDAVRHGLERVVRPRLEDAEFYYQRDRLRPLADYAEELEGVAFAPRLGTMADKARRLGRLAGIVAEQITPDAKPFATDARRAGELAKCDLVTGMVFEFPELQGIMGGIYALAPEGGERPTVAAAIGEHYLPAGPDDQLPQTGVGRAVALADRLDTLVGAFAAGQEPTGTKDPFGLRRAAFGVLRIAIEKLPALNLAPLLKAAADGYPGTLGTHDALARVEEFLRERLRSLILERGWGADVAQAVLTVAPLAPGDILARAEALAGFRTLPEAESLAIANKRIANILRQAETVPHQDQGAGKGAEKTLREALDEITPRLRHAISKREYSTALGALATLRDPVDRFFDEVLVMDPDPVARGRRLALLCALREAFLGVADIGELQKISNARNAD